MRKLTDCEIVYFDQNRELDPDVTLRRALAPDSDSVIYQDRVIHVAAWAARFPSLGSTSIAPVGRALSGGERARVLIAQLMLQPADVLLLDEPTNDLDIPTLEILEESLLEYRGALVLVTHDRYMLDRVSTVVLGLDGLGTAERFADFQQWSSGWTPDSRRRIVCARNRRLADGNGKSAPVAVSRSKSTSTSASAVVSRRHGRVRRIRKRLSYNEVRELETIEQRIADAERELQVKHDALHDPAIMSDGQRLHTASMEMESAQKAIDDLYLRWSELEAKQK